jgi:prevent-host-death family protein
MQEVNVKEARRNISRLLDAVAAGEEIIILRHGKPVVRMEKVETQDVKLLKFPDRSALRKKLPPVNESSAALIREIRDERG